MGLNYGAFNLLKSTKCIQASFQDGECSTLMLGRLKVSLSEKQKIFASKRYSTPLDRFSGYSENLLKAMGCSSVTSLDYSDFEGAEQIWNLNKSLLDCGQKSHLKNNFNLILDYGTTEHVFNPPQSIANSMAMLKVGGRLNLILPVCGSLDHGLYQLSPNWFYSMDSEWIELERLYFFVNQLKSTKLKIWDGLDKQFKKHVDGTFDGSYQANLLQYTNEKIYSFAVFRKKKELDEKIFLQETHQLIYAHFWQDKDQKKEIKDIVKNKAKIFIEKKLPHELKSLVYKKQINSMTIDISKIVSIS